MTTFNWSTSERINRLRKWQKRMKTRSLKHVKDLVPGKQGTVKVVREPLLKLDAVAKTTMFETDEHRQAISDWKKDKKGQVRPEGLIEPRVWQVLNGLVIRKKCPNFVLLYETEIAEDFHKLITYSEVWDKTLWNLSEESALGSTHFLSENAWISIFFQICAALQAMHQAGVQHQDLHANNVFIKALPRRNGYWTYIIKGKKYYCPNHGYMVAVSDYGRAFSKKLKTRSSFQTDVDDDLSSATNEFYDLERIFNSIQHKTRKHEFFNDITFSSLERTAKRPISHVLPRLFSMYTQKPSGPLLDTFRLG